jgi:hypothetical protein
LAIDLITNTMNVPFYFNFLSDYFVGVRQILTPVLTPVLGDGTHGIGDACIALSAKC